MIIVVTGLPRSGTSMMMQVLEAAGIPCVHESRADEFNPRGYYESAKDLSEVPDGHAVKRMYALAVAPPDLDARVIVMRRDPAAVQASLDRMGAARGWSSAGDAAHRQSTLDGIRLWCAGKPHIEVWYEDVLRNTPNEILRVARLLSLPLSDNLAAMANAVQGRSY